MNWRPCVMCGKPRLIERNCGQHNDGDDFCSDACYKSLANLAEPLLRVFAEDLTLGQCAALRAILQYKDREQADVMFAMLVEQLESVGITQGEEDDRLKH